MNMKTAFMAIMFLSCGAHATGCETVKEMDAADAAISEIHDWSGVNAFYRQLRQCDDGYISEGVSDAVARLLALKWSDVGQLVQVADKDEKFEIWVLSHVDSTVNDDDLNLIIKKAKDECTEKNRTFCKKIESAARLALQEQKE